MFSDDVEDELSFEAYLQEEADVFCLICHQRHLRAKVVDGVKAKEIFWKGIPILFVEVDAVQILPLLKDSIHQQLEALGEDILERFDLDCGPVTDETILDNSVLEAELKASFTNFFKSHGIEIIEQD